MAEEGAVATEGAVEGEGSPAGGAAAQPAAMDFSPLESRLDQMQTEFMGALEGIPAQLAPQEPAIDPDYDPLEEFLGNGAEYGDGGPMELDGQQLQGFIDQQVQAALEQALGPVQQQVGGIIEGQAAREVEGRHPELRDPQVATAAAQELAQRGITPDQMTPHMIEMAHEALVGRQLRSQITPAGDGASDGLEATGGGQPGTQSTQEAQDNAVNSIVGARRTTLFGT
jgi:hypothetical protein